MREGLETSARLGVEPAEERRALESRVQAALDAKSPRPQPTPLPAPLPAAAPVAGAVIPPPSPPPLAPASAVVSAVPADPSGSAPTAATARVGGPAGAASSARASPRGFFGGARHHLGPARRAGLPRRRAEGRTDPQTGRLRLRGSPRVGTAYGSLRRDATTSPRDRRGGRAVGFPRRPALPPAEPAPAATAADPGARGDALAPVEPRGPRARPSLRHRSLAEEPGEAAVPARRARPDAVVDRWSQRSGHRRGVPDAFGDYTLIRRIGKGGPGRRLRGHPARRVVSAVKRPLSGFLGDTRFRERFLREADSVAPSTTPTSSASSTVARSERHPTSPWSSIQGKTLRARLDREGRLDPTLAGASDRSGGGGARLRPQQGGDPPGPEALEHHARAVGRGEGDGLRHRPRPAPRRG